MVLVYSVPVWLMIVTSVRSSEGGVFRDWSPFKFQAFIPSSPSLDGYREVLAAGSLFRASLVNTLVVCAITVVVGTTVNFLAGFAFAHFDFPGNGLLFTIGLITFMVPFEAIVIPILTLMQRLTLVDTLAAVILPTLANGFLIFMFRQFFRGIPRDLHEAAMIDGSNIWNVIWHIYLPLSKGMLVTSAIVLFLAVWQALFLPLVVLRSQDHWVVQLALSSMQGTVQLPSWGPVLAGGVITLLIPIILIAPFMRYFKLSLFEGSSRG
jgi:multiple sugar transport system permease protein/putative chitobiose transport system permease protein